jgi:DNA-binding LacI/PurR family transcriptional regulator
MGTTVTLQTIADLLGVSRTTVSNAFARPDQLSDDLRSRILDTAAGLDYRGPNPAARTLRRGRAGVIGVVLTDSVEWAFTDPYNVEFLGALASETEAARHSLLLIPAPPGEDQADGVRNAVVDGFCVYTLPDGHPIVGEVLCRNVPTVFVDGPRADGHRFIGIRDRAAMRTLTEHALALRHRTLGVIAFRLRPDGHCGPVDRDRIATADFRVTRERLAGVFDAVRRRSDAGATVDVYEVVGNTPAAGGDAAIALLSARPRPTALLCLADQLALGALDALDTLGLRAPDDVSVTGFDDIAAAAGAGLTTIRQPAAEKGRAAGRYLAAVADGAPAPGRKFDLILPHELIERTSTGTAPSRRHRAGTARPRPR